MGENYIVIRLSTPKRCGICGKKIQKGTLVKEIHTRERENEIVCPRCLMKHKGLSSEEKMYKSPLCEEVSGEMKRKKAKNRGIL